MKKINLLISFLLLLPYSVFASDSEAVWEEIPVNASIDIIDDNGEERTLKPGCALDMLSPNPTPYKFYFKPGNSDKLVVFFNGGGACWNSATCLSSLRRGDRPTYNPSIDQANSPIGAGGIFDDNNEENPFKGWSKVFIPYCTGDLHVGSKITYYTDDGSFTGFNGAEVPIKHHGFDNFLAVREWIKDNYSGNTLKNLLVSGSSAGGYGATFNFPYLQDIFPETDAVLLSDAASEVATQGFIDTVFTDGGNWGMESTFSTATFGDLGLFSSASFNAELLEKLTDFYPDSRFAQYTTAFDVVQVQFLKIMSMIDGGSTAPEEWGFSYDDDGQLSIDDQELFGFWNGQMQYSEFSLAAIADNTDNFQYYIGAGTVHMILTDAFAINENHHPFYDENSAEGVWFTDWIDQLVNSKKFKEVNLEYSN